MRPYINFLSKVKSLLRHNYDLARIRADSQFMAVWSSIDTIPGHLVSPFQEHWLYSTAKKLPINANIVEIGSYMGRSTVSLAYACRGANRHIYAIDTFDGNDSDFSDRCFFDEFLENITKRGLAETVTPIQCLSSEAAKNWSRPIHLLFIDGSHEYDDVLQDYNNFFPHIVEGGIVALHDVVYTWEGPLRAWETVVKHNLREVGYCRTLAYGKK